MDLKAFLTRLLKDDTSSEEGHSDALQSSQAPSQDPGNTRDLEKVGSDVDGVLRSSETADERDVDVEDDDEQEYDSGTLPSVDSSDQSNSGLRRIFSRIWSCIFPSPSNEEEIQAYIPHYRVLPIVSGIAIPFCILLEIPGLTTHWYIITSGATIVASVPNPPLYDVGLSLSVLCALLACLCLVVRFLERRIKAMTILCVIFLSIHDIINVAVLAAFGATRHNYSCGQAFWMTLCSTIVSTFTNVTLIFDLIQTPDFKRRSGLTRKQRSLVIIIIGLFCYLGLGALVNALLLDLSFINALYFTVVTIETIGFGDITPTNTRSRVFICFYATLGVVNLAFVVGYVRETVLEGLDFGYRRRVLAIQERRRATRRRRRAENRWRHAIIWRLRERQAPLWIPESTDTNKSLWLKLRSGFWRAKWGIWTTARRRSMHHSHRRPGMKLNLWALPPCELEAASLEAGVPLDTLLPADFYDTYDQDACLHTAGVHNHTLPSWFVVHPVYHRNKLYTEPLTHRRLGAMAAMLTKLGLSVYESGGNPLPVGHDAQDVSATDDPGAAPDSSGSLQASSSEEKGDYHSDLMHTEKKAYFTRSGLSWGWFLIFWMGGAAIFKATEGWTYGLSVYFCFIAFSTIGYGDLAPVTPAGRSIFVVWALIGVATITIFISVVSEAYTSRFKGALGRNTFKHVAQQYRQRTRVELNEKVQRVGTSDGVKFVLRDALEREDVSVLENGSRPGTSTAGDGASTSKFDPRLHWAQRSLEQLPQQILTATQSIQQYMRLMGDFDRNSIDPDESLDKTVWSLVDDVMGGRKLTECTKMDILKDDESRQTLMMLGIERSLKDLVGVSEQAVAVIRERDRMMTTFEREWKQGEARGDQS